MNERDKMLCAFTEVRSAVEICAAILGNVLTILSAAELVLHDEEDISGEAVSESAPNYAEAAREQ